jgi:hypothetical protein
MPVAWKYSAELHVWKPHSFRKGEQMTTGSQVAESWPDESREAAQTVIEQ